MPRQLATLICFLGIFYLFWIDRNKKTDIGSKAIWVPFIWMLLAGSRYVSQWLHLGTPIDPSINLTEGSPLDRFIFLFLIILGLVILYRRHLNLRIFFHDNIWVILYFIYGAISIIWSDHPAIALKRLFKASGNIIMALVILTEKRPEEAFGGVVRRVAFLLLPLSVLFIKYYPEFGREYHMGVPMFTGVALQKNALGQLCLISGTYFTWDLLSNRKKESGTDRRLHFSIYIIIIPIVSWLFYMADSATSLICMFIAICLILVSRLPSIARNPGRILIFGLIFISIFGLLEATINVSELIIVNILGRDLTLTTRVPMWYALIRMVRNPVIGVGYDSFWLGHRYEMLMDIYGVKQAHNGYLEVYLSLGIVGLLLLITGVLFGLIKLPRQKDISSKFIILKLTFIVIILFYNWTEATFFGVNNMWLLLFFGILDISGQQETKIGAENSNILEVSVR